jgi:hypothetical protein
MRAHNRVAVALTDAINAIEVCFTHLEAPAAGVAAE